jgi:hypothetical protein
MAKVDTDMEGMREDGGEEEKKKKEKKEKKEKKIETPESLAKKETKRLKKEKKAELAAAEEKMGETEKRERKAADKQGKLVKAASSKAIVLKPTERKDRDKLGKSSGHGSNKLGKSSGHGSSGHGSSHSERLGTIGSSFINKPKKPKKGEDPNLRSTTLKAKGIKYGVTAIHTSAAVSTDGTDDDEFFWHEEIEQIKNPCWRCVRAFLVWMRCLAADEYQNTRVRNWARWVQWAALLADIAAALVSIITFNGIAYCCGTPILNFGGTNIPWHTLIRIMTYAYLAMVFLEIYPVVKKGFPFNLVNPCIGFVITLAMFFDDSKVQALMMWGIETFAVLCEFFVFRLKVMEKAQRAKDVTRIGKLTTKELDDDVDVEVAKKELKTARQRFYQLKQEQIYEDKVLWYLRVGCYLNISLVLMFLALIICISRAGGLCVHGTSLPNPFNLNPLDTCDQCAVGEGFCEVCTEESDQCYFPYA